MATACIGYIRWSVTIPCPYRNSAALCKSGKCKDVCVLSNDARSHHRCYKCWRMCTADMHIPDCIAPMRCIGYMTPDWHTVKCPHDNIAVLCISGKCGNTRVISDGRRDHKRCSECWKMIELVRTPKCVKLQYTSQQ